jgi:hypothetical protein
VVLVVIATGELVTADVLDDGVVTAVEGFGEAVEVPLIDVAVPDVAGEPHAAMTTMTAAIAVARSLVADIMGSA